VEESFTDLAAPSISITTAGLRPDLFAEVGSRSVSKTMLAIALGVLVIVGLGFRATGLSSEGLSEDELNKLIAVNDYRQHGLTSANSEHPLLMKGVLTVSVILSEKWNRTSLVASHPELNIAVESALRLPNAIVGALIAILLFLFTKELFGTEVGLIAAALWTFDPLVIGFNRIAKEDTFLVFFFLLANFFWLRGQRVAESQPHRNPEPFYWATAAAFGAMIASKYFPHMLVISLAYNYAFQGIPTTRWRIGKKRFLKFFMIMGVTFLICNPTILLPGTWRTILNFAGYKMVGHDSYEFMGLLYPHKYSDWLRGEPWYFYFVLLGTKLPVLTLLSSALGLVLMFRRKTGDGRYLVLFWLFVWTITFMFAGGKFTRYITSALPPVIIMAAAGVQFAARKVAQLSARVFENQNIKLYARAALASLVIICAFLSTTTAVPHYRLYVNSIGGGPANAGKMFPQDEFYDAYVQDSMTAIANRAEPGARVASELPLVATYYAERAHRPDLICVELSDAAEVAKLAPGDFVIDPHGRTYFSNHAMLLRLRAASHPAFNVAVGTTPAADIYVLDKASIKALRGEQ
jgi:hypothetical protein